MKYVLVTTLTVFALLSILSFCGDHGTPHSKFQLSVSNIQIKNISMNPYIALEFSDHEDDFHQHLNDFLEEAESQRIIPTGPVFLSIRNLNEGEQSGTYWEIGCPTAEGTMVKEPLKLKKSSYNRVLSFQFVVSLDDLSKTKGFVENQLERYHLQATGPIFFRILTPLLDLEQHQSEVVPIEVCVPITEETEVRFTSSK